MPHFKIYQILPTVKCALNNELNLDKFECDYVTKSDNRLQHHLSESCQTLD